MSFDQLKTTQEALRHARQQVDALRAETERLSKENKLLREAHAQHMHEGWCPMCHPAEYAAAGLNPQDIA